MKKIITKIAGIPADEYFEQGWDETDEVFKKIDEYLDQLISVMDIWEADTGAKMKHKKYLEDIKKEIAFDIACDTFGAIEEVAEKYRPI